MAVSGGILQEFFVSLGYRVDEGSRARFQSGTVEAEKAVGGLNATLQNLTKTLGQLAHALDQQSGEPLRKFTETTSKIGKLTEGLRKTTLELGKTAVATSVAFVGAMAAVAREFEQLYYVSQRTGAAAGQLESLRQAADEAGIGADNITGALEQMAQTIRAQPGIKMLVDSWIGADWDKLQDKIKGGLFPILDRLANMPRNIGYRFADMLGISRRLLDTYIANADEVKRVYAETSEINRKAGIDVQQLADRSRDFWNELRRIGFDISRIWNKAFLETFPAIDTFFKKIQSGIEWIVSFNAAHPGFAVAESVGLLVAGLGAAEGALALFGVRLALINPYILAFAAAAGLIIANWDKIAPFLERQWQKISDDFKRHDWKALGLDVGNAIKEGFLGVADWLKGLGTTLIAALREVNWNEVGRTANGLLLAALLATLDMAQWIVQVVGEMIKAIPEIAQRIAAFDWEEVGRTIGKFIADGVVAVFESADSQQQFQDALIKAFVAIGKAAVQIGWALAQGIAEGIFQKLEEILPDWVKRFLFAGAAGGVVAPGYRPERVPSREEAIGEPPAPGAAGGAVAPGYRREHVAPLEEDIGQAPHYQQGGIVRINAHEGEMVLPPSISRGLQTLFTSPVSSFAQDAANRAGAKLGDWLGGMGYVPKVVIDNIDDFARQFVQALQVEQDRRGTAGDAGGAGEPAEEAPTEPSTYRGATGIQGAAGGPSGPSVQPPSTLGGRMGAAAGRAAGAGIAGVNALAGVFTGVDKGPSSKLASEAMQYFVSQGWSHAQAAGLAANIERESSWNPRDIGDSGQAYGLGQWHPDRQALFRQQFGKDIRDSTFGEQLQFMQWELTHSEATAGAQLRAARTAGEAGAAVSMHYERPRERDSEAAARAARAEKLAQIPLPVAAPDTTVVPTLPVPASAAALVSRLPAQIRMPANDIGGTDLSLPWDRIGRASAALDRIDAATLGGGDTITNTTQGDRNVSMNVQHTVNISGGDGGDIVGKYARASRRLYGDMQRDLQASVA